MFTLIITMGVIIAFLLILLLRKESKDLIGTIHIMKFPDGDISCYMEYEKEWDELLKKECGTVDIVVHNSCLDYGANYITRDNQRL